VSVGCIFCGGRPLTREHVFSSEWLRALMPGTTTFTSDFLRIDEERNVDRGTWVEKARSAGKKAASGSPFVRCACASCNNGWMQELDERAKPLLTPLALGESGTVSAAGLQLLATWATKIALVLDAFMNPMVLGAEAKQAFRRSPAPLPASTVRVGVMSPVDNRVRIRMSSLTPSPTSNEARGYVATFGVLHLAAQVMYPLLPSLVLRPNPEYAHLMRSIWPSSGTRLPWPLPERSWMQSEQEFEQVSSQIQASGPGGAVNA
jgi:hypothetical protein